MTAFRTEYSREDRKTEEAEAKYEMKAGEYAS